MNDLQLKRELTVHGIDLVGAETIDEKAIQFQFDKDTIFRRVLDFALEASGPKSRSPAAVFMYILKKELGYLTD
jgi:hypothetical protein